MTSDRYRPLTAAAVLLVAAIAAVVSYLHVATLALAYGQPSLAAYLRASRSGSVSTQGSRRPGISNSPNCASPPALMGAGSRSGGSGLPLHSQAIYGDAGPGV